MENDKEQKAIDLLEKNIKKCEDYIGRAKDIHNTLPYIVLTHGQLKWQYDVFQSKPEGVGLDINNDYIDNLEYINKNMPELPIVHATIVSSISAVSTSGTTNGFYFIGSGNQDDPRNREWYNKNLSSFRELIERDNLLGNVSANLKKLNSIIAQEFDIVVGDYYRIVTTEDILGTAIKMRNVLEHVKGKLLQKAKTPREQKTKWSDMASILAKGGHGGIEHKDLITEENNYKNLHSDLSNIAKNIKKVTKEEFEVIFFKLILHLYTVLNLIDPKYLVIF